MTAKPHNSDSQDKRLQLDALEPRILMSATWVDPETGDSIPVATADGDRFEGSNQDDTADGLGGSDELLGNAGNDILSGSAGDDILRGGAGDDTLDGGADVDVVDYSDGLSSITIDITDVGNPQDTGGAGTDTLYGIEGVVGSSFDDSFAFSNPIPGQSYTVDGGAGFNTLDLSDYDRADLSFSADASSVEVDLGSGNSFAITFDNVSRVLTSDFGSGDVPEVIAPPTLQLEEGTSPQLGLLVVGGDPATMTWSWNQTGGTPIALDDASSARPVATVPEGLVDSTASFDVDLTIGGVTTTTAIEIDIAADNDAADITASDVTVPENSVVQLSASIDEPEGQPYLYTWSQVSGPSVTLTDAFSLNPSFTAPELAATTNIVFELSVTDGTTTATQQITVTVNADDDGPTANAGADATVAEDERSTDNTGADTYTANSYTLSGSGSDPENQALTYTWRQIGGPSVTLDDAGLSNPTFTVPQGAAQYDLQFELSVSDGTNVSTDTVTVTVAADQDTAVVDSLTGGVNGVTGEGATTAIAVSAYDPEGTPLTYTWRQVGGDPIVIADPTAAATTFTATNQMVDTYVSLEVDIVDADGTVSTKSMTILVQAQNDAPTTDLGGDRTVAGNDSVSVTTTASDPEGKPLVHRWTQTGGPAVTFTGQGRDTLAFTAAEYATDTELTFEVETTDGVTTVTDTITITVEATDAGSGGSGSGGSGSGGSGSGGSGSGGGGGGSGGGGTPLTVDVGNFLDTNEGDATPLSVDVTAFNGPGPLTYDWTQVSGESVTILDDKTADASFAAPDLTGTRVLQFEVVVSDGATTITELVSVTVIANNDTPTVNAGANQSVAEEGSVQLAASASDPEGKNLAGRWEQVSGPVVEIANIYDPNTTVTTPNIVGTTDAVLRWVASDGENQVSDTVAITIVADNDAPIVDAGPAANIPEASSYQLNPSVSDPEEQPLTYTWTQTSGPAVTLSDPTAERPSFSTPNVTSDTPVEFELTVSDGVHTVTDSVSLTIVANDDPPTVDAGAFQTVGEGDTVQLAGTANDPEGLPIDITWTQVSGPSVTLSDASVLNPTFEAPNELANTYVTFRIEADDGTSTVSDTVTILINADNDAPTNDAGADQTVAEESTVTLNGTAADPEGQQLTHQWVQVSGPPVTLSGATGLSPTFDAPNVLNNESIVFQLETRDGTFTVVDTVTVTVTGVNDAPEAVDVSASGVEDAASISVYPTGTDADYGDEVESIRVESLPANGTLMFQGGAVSIGDVLPATDVDGGDLTFVPDADWGGTTTFEFRVSDGELWSTTAGTSTIDVDARADDADITTGVVAGDEDTAIPTPISVATTDADGSETVRRIQVQNAPVGSVFSDGVNSKTFTGGRITITGWDLPNLTITPPLHHDLDFTFQIRAQTEDSNGHRKHTTATIDVDINPINDAPFVANQTTTTTEDTDVAIDLTATEVDTGDVPEMYRLDTLPDPAAGVLRLNGSAVAAGDTVMQAQVDAGLLRFDPVGDLHGSASFEFSAWDGELWSTDTAEFTVEITADADAPTVTVPAAIQGDEDAWINLPIDAAVTDTDGSEAISNVSVQNLPVGATVSDGVNSFTATVGTTSVDVTSWNLGDVQVMAPEHSDVDFTLQVAATSQEASNGDTATTTQSVAVQVDPVIDSVVLPSGSAATVEDTSVSLGLGLVFADNDGSESHVLVLGGLPDGATISDGSNTFTASGGASSVDVGTWNLGNVTITPPDDSDADFQITVVATTTEADGGATDSDSGTIDIAVTADADAPSVSVSPASGAEDQPISLSINAQLTDADGSESMTVLVSQIPVGATLTDGVNTFVATGGSTAIDVTSWSFGSMTVQASADSGDDFTLVVTATSTEADGGDTAATITNLPVTVVADADAPTLSVGGSVSTLEDTPVGLTVDAALTDSDGSETLAIEIEGIPVGATISDGVNTFVATGGSTTVDVTGWNMGLLAVTPPLHSDGNFTLAVVATATEGENGDAAETRDTIDVTVTAVVDAPGFSAGAGTGNEDAAIAFSINPTLTDTDGSETIDVQLSGIPDGAVVTDGVNSFAASGGSDSVNVTGWSWSALTVTPPSDDASEFDLTVTTTATESSNGQQSTRQDTVDITVLDRADAPTLTVSDTSGLEDTAIDLAISSALTDTDGSETLAISISQIPVGATVGDGVNTFTATGATTSVDVTSWSLGDLQVTPPPNSDVEFDLRVTATATEADGGHSSSTVQDIGVTVTSQTDAPTLSTTAGSGTEDTAIRFGIDAELIDTDGSESLTVIVSEIPQGATLTDGVSTFTASGGSTSVDVSSWNRDNLSITPPSDSDAEFTLQVAATSEDTDGSPVTVADTIDITVAADADAPKLTTPTTVNTTEDTAVAVPINAVVSDVDGSESIAEIEVLDLPDGATITDGVNTFTATSASNSVDITAWNHVGLRVTPPSDSSDDFSIRVRATSAEADGGDKAATTNTVRVVVAGDADAPVLTVADSSGNEDTAIDLDISSSLTDTDGSESLTVEVDNLPVGAVITDGVNTFVATGGSTLADVTGWDFANLTVTPPPHSEANFTVDVIATSTEVDGDTAEARDTIGVTVTAITDAPTFAATNGAGVEDSAIGFTIDPRLVDTDGSETINVQLGDIPIGATIGDGANTFTATAGNTTVDVTAWDWNALTVTPPSDDASEFSLEVLTTATETSTGATSSRQDSVAITVLDRADAPAVAVANAAGTEDTAIDLSISSSLTDTDGSETLTTTISQVPVGATITDGVNTFTATVGATIVDVSSWTLTGIKITPPADSDDDFALRVTSTTTEADNGDTSTVVQDLVVTVVADTDAPTLTTTAGSGQEDAAIAFSVSSALTDTDGSESLAISISSVPVGATISDGVNAFTATGGNTTLDATGWDLANMSVTPPADSDAEFTLDVAATAVDADGGPVTVQDTVAITVAADADAPTLSTPGTVSTTEDASVAVPIVAVVSDTDGSESITTVAVFDLPVGTTVTDGINTFTATVVATSVDITAWNQASFALTPPANSDADFTIQVRATSTEADGGDTATTTNAINVAVTADADAAAITTHAAVGTEDTRIDLDLGVALTDTDGTESLQVEVRDVPVGATLTDGVSTFTATVGATTVDISGWSQVDLGITPPADDADDFHLTIVATTTEANGGDQQVTTAQLPVSVVADADAPVVTATGGAGTEDTAVSFTISPQLTDTDGSEGLSVAIENIPIGATISDGNNSFLATASGTTADVTGWSYGTLTITPPADSDDDFVLTIAATATEAEGDAATTRTTANIQVAADADAPTLTTTAAAGDEDTRIAIGISAGLTDTDGSEELTLVVQGLPDGSVLTDGVNRFVATASQGSVDVTSWTLDTLTVQPPANSDDEFHLTVVATSTEANGGDAAVTTNTIPVTVNSVADDPELVTVGGSGDEDEPITFGVRGELTDTDGSENLTITLSGVPPGATVTDGVNTFTADRATTSTSLDGWDLGSLEVVPPSNDDSDFRMTVTAVSVDTDGGTATVSDDVLIQVAPVADAPIVVTSPATGVEDAAISLDIRVALPDDDGSESVRIVLSGAPTGSLFTDGTHEVTVDRSGEIDITGWDLGSLEVLPRAHAGDDFVLTVEATTTEQDGGRPAVTTTSLGVSVTPIADDPDGEAPNRLQVLPNQPQPFPLDMSTVDQDGSERLGVRVSGLWAGVQFSAGVDNGDGSWTFEYSELEDLMITAPPNGTTELTIEFLVEDGDSSAIATTRTIIQTLDLTAVQDGPEAAAWAPLPEANFDIGTTFREPPTSPATDIDIAATTFALPPVQFSVGDVYETEVATYTDAESASPEPAKANDEPNEAARGEVPHDAGELQADADGTSEVDATPARPWYVRLWTQIFGGPEQR